MACDSKATPQEQFDAWLAEHATGLGRRQRFQPARPPLVLRVAALAVSLMLWVLILWSLGAGVQQVLRIL